VPPTTPQDLPPNRPTRRLIKGPKGPEPALGFFEKKTGLSHSGRFASKATKQQKFSPNEPGGRANVFFVLRYYYYVNVTFSSTIRNRSGRNVFRFRLRYVTGAGVKRIALKDPGRHFPVPYY
jgi:hypothetical protein